MPRDRRNQAGDFEKQYAGRNSLNENSERGETGTDFVVTREELRRRSDGRASWGSHRGKGPKNYRRRDERILEDINDRMCDNAYLDASEIDVSVLDGNVFLSGTVENRESKRLAEDIAESVSGVQNVENTLRVNRKGI